MGPEPLGWRLKALRYTVLAGGRDAPVGRPQAGDFFGTNTYQKGGWVLHMLREQLGEVAFWSGVREYYAAHRFGNVTTADLRQALEAASGQDLAPFFAQWVDRAGNPVVDLYWKWSPNRVDLRFCQAGRPFTLRLTPVVHWQGQNQSLRSPQPILLDGPEVTVGLDLPFRGVSGITPDPDFATLADFRVHRVTGTELPACGGA